MKLAIKMTRIFFYEKSSDKMFSLELTPHERKCRFKAKDKKVRTHGTSITKLCKYSDVPMR